jgi:hypothetical protein
MRRITRTVYESPSLPSPALLEDGESIMPASEGDACSPIGRVVSVSGAQLIALLLGQGGPASADPAGAAQMGAIVKIPTARSIVYGMICGLRVPLPSAEAGANEFRLLELELLGECPIVADVSESIFSRGVSVWPSLGSPVFAATADDLRLVYARPGKATTHIGKLHQDPTLPTVIGINDLLGKHFAVVGTTGSGKSCAVTVILRAILNDHRSGHILLLDPHNEYPRAFGASAEVINPSTLQLPYWLFNFEELCEVLKSVGAEIGTAESAILNELIPTAKRQYLGAAAEGEHLTANTPSPYRLTSVIQYIDEMMGKLEKPDSLSPYYCLKRAFNTLMTDARFSFMIPSGIAMRDNMAAILARIFRVPVEGKPLTILDLSAIPSEILNVVVSVLCRTAFDFAMWTEGAIPILLVCEEAHRYAPEGKVGFEPTKLALSRIAKEGRKYGLSLCVVSQRPSELAAGMLSQCSTIFAMRLTSQKDQALVRAAISDSASGLLEALPSLGNAEAIAVGEGVPIPLRLVFDKLPAEGQPKSTTADFSEAWKRDMSEGGDFLNAVVDRWRRQSR